MLSSETLLYRVVPPERRNYDPTVLPVRTFRLRPRDFGQLSFSDSTKISAHDCLRHYNGNADRPPARAIAVITVKELQDLKLPAAPDPEESPDHVLVDFRHLDDDQKTTYANQLLELAQARGPIIDP